MRFNVRWPKTVSMENLRKILEHRWAFLFIIAFGLAARVAATTLGENYDMRSFHIVAQITRHGGNVYAETSRYNYGPVWFLIVHQLDLMVGHWDEVLRYLVAGFLSLVDLGIFFLLLRQAGRVAAVLFFLNPVSILISGYHCQFDNVAIFLGLWSVRLIGDDFENPINRRKFAGLLVLGLSLMTKHLFFLFPLWLAAKQKGLWQKIMVMVVPVGCFLLAFAPYWAAGRNGICLHVFHYVPMETNLFYHCFVPPCIQRIWDNESLWFLLLILFAFICRPRTSFQSLLVYTGLLVAFSAATANQYLAIPVALAAVFPNPFFLLYTGFSTVCLGGDPDGPRLLYPPHEACRGYAIYALCGALAWLLWRPKFLRLFEQIGRELEIRPGRLK